MYLFWTWDKVMLAVNHQSKEQNSFVCTSLSAAWSLLLAMGQNIDTAIYRITSSCSTETLLPNICTIIIKTCRCPMQIPMTVPLIRVTTSWLCGCEELLYPYFKHFPFRFLVLFLPFYCCFTLKRWRTHTWTWREFCILSWRGWRLMFYCSGEVPFWNHRNKLLFSLFECYRQVS